MAMLCKSSKKMKKRISRRFLIRRNRRDFPDREKTRLLDKYKSVSICCSLSRFTESHPSLIVTLSEHLTTLSGLLALGKILPSWSWQYLISILNIVPMNHSC